MKRAEFSAKTKVAAFERSGGRCESCGRKLLTGDINYDHAIPCECGGDASLANCSVLCRACHGTKTREQDLPRISKGRRVRRGHIGVSNRRRRFIGWRRFDGSVVKVCLIAAVLVAIGGAVRADVWYSCESLIEFCASRPYHRDCSPRSHGIPLSISVECSQPTPTDQFEECRKHPYNMFCTKGTVEWCTKVCEPEPPQADPTVTPRSIERNTREHRR